MSTFKKVIENLVKKQKEQEQLNESIVPSVGIFYFVDNVIEVWEQKIPIGKIKGKQPEEVKGIVESFDLYMLEIKKDIYIGFKQLHIDMYKKLIKRIYPEVKTWTDIPRGRVTYNLTKDKFIVILDKCLNEKKFLTMIRKEFNLPEFEVEFDSKNYVCLNCKGE